MIASPWVEVGELMEDTGDIGGDIQVGKAPGRRFTHTSLPGRVVDIAAYPILGDGTDPMHPEGVIRVQMQTQMTVCRDVEDPGSTEVCSDIEYSRAGDLPERFARDYPDVESAQAAARALIVSMEPHHIGWDGLPGMSLD